MNNRGATLRNRTYLESRVGGIEDQHGPFDEGRWGIDLRDHRFWWDRELMHLRWSQRRNFGGEVQRGIGKV